MNESEVGEVGNVGDEGGGDVGVIEVDAGDGDDGGVVGCMGAYDAAILAYFWAHPVGRVAFWVGNDGVFKFLEGLVGYLELDTWEWEVWRRWWPRW